MKKTFLLIAICQMMMANAQVQPTSKNFREISRQMNDYYKQAGKTAPGYKQFKRWEWYYSTRTGEGGMLVDNERLNKEALQTSSANRSSMMWRTDANTGSWTSLGPSSVSSSDK